MPNAKRGERSRGITKLSASSFGLGAFFSSMLIYAGSVTPFLRYDGITDFVSMFARISLASLLLVSVVLAIALYKGVTLPSRGLKGAGGVLYVLSGAAFCFMAVSSVDEPVLLYAGGIACGCGNALMCLVWGRIFRRFSLNEALVNIACACVLASLVYGVITYAPPLVGVAVFMTCTVLAIVVPLLTQESQAGQVDVPTTVHTLLSFVSVIAKPALGLLVFSYVMGLTCYTFVDVFDLYLAAAILSAAVLGVLACLKLPGKPLTRLLYRDLVPLFAIVALAIPNITNALIGESPLTMLSTLLLYTFAAFLTLATLCAIANASEFSSDFVFATALVLFAAASLAGLASSEALSPAMANVMVTVVTTVYAFILVVMRDEKTATPWKSWHLSLRNPGRGTSTQGEELTEASAAFGCRALRCTGGGIRPDGRASGRFSRTLRNATAARTSPTCCSSPPTPCAPTSTTSIASWERRRARTSSRWCTGFRMQNGPCFT